MIDKSNEYIVSIITDKGQIDVKVTANNKSDAKEIISNMLIRCDLFGFNSIKDFKLKCKRCNE